MSVLTTRNAMVRGASTRTAPHAIPRAGGKRFIAQTPSRYPTPTNPLARPDLQYRIADRPLPSLASVSSRRRWLTTIPLFLAILTASAAGIFNYQKVNSPIVAATLYSLRTNPRVREELGDEVYFANNYAWIWGHINLVQGRVDISFRVKGTRAKGMCRFRATRTGSRAEIFKTQEWSLELDDGRTIHLLEDDAREPLEGAAF